MRSERRQTCGRAANSCARSTAACRAWPGGTSRLTRPMASASGPSTARPLKIRSMARPWPMIRGSRTVPRSHSGTPKRRQNTPKTASSAATRRSHQSASSRPPATANPSTAATTGFLSVRRVGPIGPGPWSGIGRRSPSEIAFRSAPAQKVPPVPVNTATDEPSSASNSSKTWRSRAAQRLSTAFLRSGRSMDTTVTRPSRSTMTPERAIGTRPRAGRRAHGCILARRRETFLPCPLGSFPGERPLSASGRRGPKDD